MPRSTKSSSFGFCCVGNACSLNLGVILQAFGYITHDPLHPLKKIPFSDARAFYSIGEGPKHLGATGRPSYLGRELINAQPEAY